MMRILFIPALLGLLALSAVSAREGQSGISFYVLRVIYPQSEKNGVILTAHNNTPVSYLMQSGIRPIDPATGDVDLARKGSPAIPFIVTPPLARLDANSGLTLRIRRNDMPLPQDRESVFFVSMKAMPAQPQMLPPGKMVMTVVSNIKLFYRPSGLATRAVADMAPKLTFRRAADRLIVTNPTPYWLTFSRLKVGNTALAKPLLRLMVPPFGQQDYPLPASTTGKVAWQLIDEDGWNTPEAQQAL